MNLILIADPMSSWCYSFGKEITTFSQKNPDLPLRIVVGGLRAGFTSVMTKEARDSRLSHWNLVEAASGLPFNRSAFVNRKNFIYNTEPICRALVTARKLAPKLDLLSVFRQLQEAFYLNGQDTTNEVVLAHVATQAMYNVGFDIAPESFLAIWNDKWTINETRVDFIKARSWGIYTFPALLLEVDGSKFPIALGYTLAYELQTNFDLILKRLERLEVPIAIQTTVRITI
jgi:putative protein-disulfide isomerase